MRKVKAFLYIALALSLSLWCSTAQAAGAPAAEYLLGSDDVIEIFVSNHDNLNRVVTVRPDGKVTLPRVGDIKASGGTAPALAKKLQAIYAKWYNHANVTVSVKEVHSRRVRVLGAVKTAGTYELKENWKLMDVVAVAGGLSAKSVRISGRVVRDGKIIDLNVDQAVRRPDTLANLPLESDDLIMLDAADVSKQVTIIGQVGKPGAYDLDEGLSPVSLIAQAGGFTGGAALNRAYVLRGTDQLPINLQTVLVDGQEDSRVTGFKFLSGDALVIPENLARYGIMGQVIKPGYYPYPAKQSDATVLKALASAGGSASDGDLRNATVTRLVNGQSSVTPVNIELLLKGTVTDIPLGADDVLYIPQANNWVTVTGQVAKPGAYNLNDNTTLISLIGLAGGPSEGAALSQSYIRREGSQVPVDLQAMLVKGGADAGLANDKLRPGDVVVVPEVAGRYAVMGEVKLPGKFHFPDQSTPTVLDALTNAGGQLPNGNLGEAGIIRVVAGQSTVIPVNLNLIVRKGNGTNTNIEMLPGDVLYIPQKKDGGWMKSLGPIALIARTLF